MDSVIIVQAKKLISEFHKSFARCQQSSPDYVRIQRNIREIQSTLERINKENNKSLIALEKFYQSTSLIIGLGAIKLDNETLDKWRSYDRFHFDNVKPKLKLYGPIVV
ncbi:helicase BlpT [Streptococcus pluranimalium]|uniref:helicase BlpT n=1 Tax=Streptococcus pluranimalium TaxID=82348 RepID=UPI003F694B1E